MSRIDFQNGFALGLASGGVVESGENSKLNALEGRIDESGVLGSTEGTLTEKVVAVLFYADMAQRILKDETSNVVTIPPMDYSSLPTLRKKFMNYQNIENIQGEINCSNCTDLRSMCQGCSKLKSIELSNTDKVYYWSNAFNGCTSLETVSLLNCINSNGFTSTFLGCNALKNIEFVPETIKQSIEITSPVLSDESIQSIVDGLAYVTISQILTLHTDVKAKLTEDQLVTITNKNWSVA